MDDQSKLSVPALSVEKLTKKSIAVDDVLSVAPVARSTNACVPFWTPPEVDDANDVVRVVTLAGVGMVPVPPLMIPFHAAAPEPAVKVPSLVGLNVQFAMSMNASV